MLTNSTFDNSLRTNRELTATPSNKIVQDSIGLFDRDDYYRVNFTGRSSVSLSLKGLSDNANLALLDSTGRVISRSAERGKLDETINTTLNPGTYYIHVNRDSVLVKNANYSLNYRATDVSITLGTKVDFDGDGKSDILWRNESTKAVSAWLMDGLSIKAGAPIGHNPMTPDWKIAGIADFDGDGKSDILWRNESTKAVSAWLMDGLSIKAGAPIGHNPMTPDWKIQGGSWEKGLVVPPLFLNPTTSNPLKGLVVPPLFLNPTTSNPLKGFQDPLKGVGSISQGTGGRGSHEGSYSIDFATGLGTSVYAMRTGKIVLIDQQYPDTGGGREKINQVNMIVIEHDNGYYSRYLHLQQNFNSTVQLKVGQTVEAGQLIAFSGNSGYSSGPHLHVEVDKGVTWKSQPFEIDGVFKFA